jgi:hypothetical protein
MARRWLAAFLCALLAGCSSQANVRAGLSGASTSAGSQVSAHVQSGSVLGTLLAVGILAAAWYGEDRERYGLGAFPGASAPVPPLDESRRVNQQDCTRPIEDRAANLRCR